MAKLILKFNNEVVDHIELQQGDMKIGRKSTNDIFIDNLAISGEHANIFTIGGDSFVQDLGSTNGTMVNDNKIAKHHLKNGDVIMIGKHSLVYIAENAESDEEKTEDFAKTVIIGPGSMPDLSSPPASGGGAGFSPKETMSMSEDKQKASAGRQGAIFVLSGANSGKRIDLMKSITNLGKTGSVSGSIKRSPSGYTLGPAAGGKPPKLNGRELRAGEDANLKNGDIIEVAGTRLQFYLK